MTFLGDVETIPRNESVTSDFFPLPPPILPHPDGDAAIERRNGDDNSNRDASKKSTNLTSASTDSPDYVESSV